MNVCGECGSDVDVARIEPIGVFDGDVYYACRPCRAELIEAGLVPTPSTEREEPS